MQKGRYRSGQDSGRLETKRTNVRRNFEKAGYKTAQKFRIEAEMGAKKFAKSPRNAGQERSLGEMAILGQTAA
jgi:hypothetical protein